jgi:iron complex outermembrane recepter protein
VEACTRKSTEKQNRAAAVGQASVGVLEEVVVTAMKRKQSLMEVPTSIQIMSGDYMKAQGIDNFASATEFVPSATLPTGAGAGIPYYSVRGTGAQGQFGDPAVGFYIDQIPYMVIGRNYGPDLDLYDIESLQVLRGPQGTLYGQGSMGGTFLVTTAQPDLEEITGRTQVYGSEMKEGGSGSGVDGMVSVPIIKDELALRVTGSYENVPGLAESPDVVGKNIDDAERWNVRTKLRYEPTDTLSVNSSYWHNQIDQNSDTMLYVAVDPPTISPSGGFPGEANVTVDRAGVTVNWDNPLGMLTATSSYLSYHNNIQVGYTYQDFIGPGQIADFTGVQDTKVDGDTYNQEVRLTSTSDGPTQWIVGANFTDGQFTDHTTAEFSEPSVDGVPIIPLQQNYTRVESTQYALFGEISHEFMNGLLTPLVGLRQFEDSRDQVNEGNQVAYTKQEKDFSSTSPRFNLKITPNDNTTIYLNAAHGFRSGGFNNPNIAAVGESLGLTVQLVVPEAEVWTYEIGGRFVLLDGSLLLEPTIYLSEYTDYPFETNVGGLPTTYNLDEVESTGAELVFTYDTPLEGLSFQGMGAINSTEPTKLNTADASLLTTNLAKNEQLPYVPEWEYRLAANYEQALGGTDWTGFGTLSFYERASQKDYTLPVPSAELQDVSLRAGVRNDSWMLTAWGNNLNDEKGPSGISSGLMARYDRRSIGVSAQYYW